MALVPRGHGEQPGSEQGSWELEPATSSHTALSGLLFVLGKGGAANWFQIKIHPDWEGKKTPIK